MKKITTLLILTVLISSCSSSQSKKKLQASSLVIDYAKSITKEELKEALYIYASNDFEGRKTGASGQKKAVEFIKKYYVNNNIPSPIANGDYFQKIPEAYFKGRASGDSENVMAYIKGSEKPNEVVIISAHLDHIGVTKDGLINNGADDDGSGTVALLEMAEAFKLAADKGHGPKRSVLFLHVTGEEIGLFGSKYYVEENPIFPLKNTVADLNIDMIGRIDDKHKNNSNYLYLIGSDKLSKELHNISEAVNNKYFNINFDYTFNEDDDPNRFYYRSDHYNFAKNNIPVIFYFNGTHDDYHKPTDTPDKIEYDLLEKRTRLIFHTAWELANRDERVKVD
ncbi:M28 family metallopeptidase [Postechiella marina]|uniref:M28 family metallopeptidase n=1 Tax=Postechiella marina TaxID=943941 RepID=A0ABP8C0L9_9FLAO